MFVRLEEETMSLSKCSNVFGKRLIEKRGKKWLLTDFGFEIWGKTREEVETDG
jgi:hypothetical protein